MKTPRREQQDSERPDMKKARESCGLFMNQDRISWSWWLAWLA
jgi:hypothetical protein